MAEYIKRETVINHLDACMDTIWKPEIVALKCFVEGIPAADVAPVRYGWWRPVHESEATGWDPKLAGSDPIWGYVCTNCRNEAIFDCNDEYILSDYCPNCGAHMKKEDKSDG